MRANVFSQIVVMLKRGNICRYNTFDTFTLLLSIVLLLFLLFIVFFFFYSALDLFWAMASLLLVLQDSRVFKT
jgi:hypothetical protein